MDRQPHDDLIGNDLAENYREILADKNRGLTTKRLAERAEAQNDHQLAKWARAEAGVGKATRSQTPSTDPDEAAKQRSAAAADGADTTPKTATSKPGKADASESKPRTGRGRASSKASPDPAEERKAAESVIADSLDDQLAPPAPAAGDDDSK